MFLTHQFLKSGTIPWVGYRLGALARLRSTEGGYG